MASITEITGSGDQQSSINIHLEVSPEKVLKVLEVLGSVAAHDVINMHVDVNGEERELPIHEQPEVYYRPSLTTDMLVHDETVRVVTRDDFLTYGRTDDWKDATAKHAFDATYKAVRLDEVAKGVYPRAAVTGRRIHEDGQASDISEYGIRLDAVTSIWQRIEGDRINTRGIGQNSMEFLAAFVAELYTPTGEDVAQLLPPTDQ